MGTAARVRVHPSIRAALIFTAVCLISEDRATIAAIKHTKKEGDRPVQWMRSPSLFQKDELNCMQFILLHTVRINLSLVSGYSFNPDLQELTVRYGSDVESFEGEFAVDLMNALDSATGLRNGTGPNAFNLPSSALLDWVGCHAAALDYAAECLSIIDCKQKESLLSELLEVGRQRYDQQPIEELIKTLDRVGLSWQTEL